MRPFACVFALGVFGLTSSVHAYQPITRPFESVRGFGMGNVRYTTGLYEQNFHGNPARATQNPKWKIGLLDPMIEVSSSTVGVIGDIAASSDNDQFGQIADTAGRNNHGRFQLSFPSFFLPNVGGGKWSYAFGLLTSVQGDAALLSTFNIEEKVQIDIGPAMTIARKLLPDDALSVGLTAHAKYRLQSQSFDIFDLIGGQGFSATSSGLQGGLIDFDIGGTYKLPIPELLGFNFEGALAINNLLGGKYKNSLFNFVSTARTAAPPQPRSYNFGVVAKREQLAVFTDFLVALEFTDLGNNGGGSIFRTVHLGSEARWKLLAVRTGFNQGYITAGLGIDLKILSIDFATYGEELGLNVGDRQDRRFAVRFAFAI